MAITTQIWRPDTCGCVIEQTHDPADPSAPVSFSRVLQKCEAHAGVADAEIDDTLSNPVRGENRRKNRIRNRIFEQFGVEASFAWQGTGRDRVLVITAQGITANQQSAAQTWADTNIGVGRVLIQRA